MKMGRSKGDVTVMTDEARQRKPELEYMWKRLQPRSEEICLLGQKGFRLRNTICKKIGVRYGL